MFLAANPIRSESGPRRKLLWCLKVILAFACALVVWEITLSNVYLRTPASVMHPVLGRIYGQGLYVQGREGFARTVLNELGMRQPPLTAKEPGVERILVLGDSFTQAMQVSDQAIFTHQLQERLGARSEVINDGRSGTSPAYYLAQAEFNKKTFEPDLVIIQLNQGDFTSDHFDSQTNFYFVQTETGFELKENKAYVSGNPIISRFAQFQKILNFSVARVLVERLAKLGARPAETPPRPSATEAAEELKIQEALITWVVRELKAHYPKLILVYIPTIDYFGDQAQSSVELQLVQAARGEGVPFVSVYQDYIDVFKIDRRVAHGFDNTQPGLGHINALGHALLAERLAEMMKQVVTLR